MTTPVRIRCAPADVGAASWSRRIAGSLDETGSCVVVIDGTVDEWRGLAPGVVRATPAVMLGIVRGAPSDASEAAEACDLLLRIGPDDTRAASEWVDARCAELDRAPLAFTVLARTLRLTERLPVDDALVVESAAYGVLQDGPEHTRWLGERRTGSGAAR